MNPIKPIRTEADYEEALAEIQRLDILVTLVEAYEAKHWRIDPPDPIAAIELRMQQQGRTCQELEKIRGGKNRVSEVLHRKRPLTLEMIRRLHILWGIPAESLIQPTTRRRRAKRTTAKAV